MLSPTSVVASSCGRHRGAADGVCEKTHEKVHEKVHEKAVGLIVRLVMWMRFSSIPSEVLRLIHGFVIPDQDGRDAMDSLLNLLENR